MYKIIMLLLVMSSYAAPAQELYVFSEPASNMPAHSLTPKLSATLGNMAGGLRQRYTPELMLGFNQRLMVHTAASFSNMQSDATRWESAYIYGKYRFYSADEVHRHFRMAFFAEGAYHRGDAAYDEISLQGSRSGVQLGLIATQLLGRVAFSATVSQTQALDPARYRHNDPAAASLPYQSLNYSLSAGCLVLPATYTSYRQLNLNLYTELLGQRTLDQRTYYLDLAPAVQLLFNSNSKLNLGYRFQLRGNQTRSFQESFLVSFEHTFFNALKK